MEKYNLSAEKTVKFLYRGKINRVKDNKGVFTDNSSNEKFGSNFLQEYFNPSKNKYVISWEEINRTEIKKRITLPRVLKDYYHECGDLDINTACSELLKLEDIYFSHDGLREFLEDDEYSEEQIEKILQKTENILIFWCENQGVWNAGIKKEDLSLKNPPIYMSTNDDLYSWEKVTEDIDTFIISQVIDNIESTEIYTEIVEGEKIENILSEKKISYDELKKSRYISSNEKIKFSNYADYDSDTIYLFILNSDEIKRVYIVKPKEKKIKENIDNKIFIEIGRIISRGNIEVVTQLEKALNDIEEYLKENRELGYKIGELNDKREQRVIKLNILVNILEKSNYLIYLDWKCELEDFKMLDKVIGKTMDKKIVDIFREINFDEDEDIIVWSEEFDKHFEKLELLLASFDLDSDSYAIFPIDYENFKNIENMLKNIQLRVDFAKKI